MTSIYPTLSYHSITIISRKSSNSVWATIAVYIVRFWIVTTTMATNAGATSPAVRSTIRTRCQNVPPKNRVGLNLRRNMSMRFMTKAISVRKVTCSSFLGEYSEAFVIFLNFSALGYIRNQINDMRVLCTPLFPNDSMLECSKHLRFCRGRNIMINFTDVATIKEPFRYRMDVLKPGQIGEQNGFTNSNY